MLGLHKKERRPMQDVSRPFIVKQNYKLQIKVQAYAVRAGIRLAHTERVVDT